MNSIPMTIQTYNQPINYLPMHSHTPLLFVLKTGLLMLCLLMSLGVDAQTKDHKRTILLDYLDINKLTQTIGRPQVTGERADLKINKRRFIHGIHTRTESRLYLELDGKTDEFSAEVGIDDRSTAFRVDTVDKTKSTANFYVIGDGKVLWESGLMKYGENAKPVHVQLAGIKELLLKVTGGPGNTHVDWVDAKLTYSGAMPKTIWSPEDRAAIENNLAFIRQQNERYPQPRINGAMKVGIRPNTPLYYPVAATGIRPMTFQVTGMPPGLMLDKNTGIIRGKVQKAGDYTLQLTVTNKHGKAQRSLKLLVGDKLALTPPMGYLSWNVVEGLISEPFIRELADAMEQFGLRDVGYQYINMDDCWQGSRDSSGNITPDRFRFPNGMKVVGDYLHTKGFKFGIYSSPGPTTCAGYPGTLNFEESDARTWASWGIDYVKYDGCSVPGERAKELYGLMGNLLKESGRSIVYSGRKDSGAHLWRIGGDLRDQWYIEGRDVGIIQSFEKAIVNASTQQPGGWVDPDMLVIGIYGKGNSGNDKTDSRGCTDTEYQSQMSLWALMSAPLFITADIRRISQASLEILTNPEVIEVNQDPLGNFPKRVGGAGEQEIWVKEMEDGSKTVALFNKSSQTGEMTLKWTDIGLTGAHSVRDIWLRKELGKVNGSLSMAVPSHGVALIRIQ